MKKYKFIYYVVAVFIAGLWFTSCGDDFLTAKSPNTKPYGTVPVTEVTINQNLASAYHILLRDNYASGYNQRFFTSDIRSDDAFKGGENAADQGQLEKVATFTASPDENLSGLWELYYRGVARCNETLANIEKIGGTGGKLPQYKAEALFLRAYYYSWLWKNWGNIPYSDAVLTAATDFIAPQLTAAEVYEKMYEDIKAAEATGALQMKSAELARVNLAAVYMLKAEIVMYQNDQKRYDEVAGDMAAIITSNAYTLFGDFDKMWLQENEWCSESIFESNMGAGQTAWGTSAGNPYGFGTNLPRFISPSELVDPAGVFLGGWGFAPVRPYLYQLIGSPAGTDKKQAFFEAGDIRREASINYWPPNTYTHNRYCATGYVYRKYAARAGYNNTPSGDTDINYCNNDRIYRFAETLLNYAELVGVKGVAAKQGVTAQDCLNKVRTRAKVGSIPVTQENIELERHREFIGEGRRYWDLVRWGKAAKELTENFTFLQSDGSTSVVWQRTWTDNKKYLPIPQAEVLARMGTPYEIVQNPY